MDVKFNLKQHGFTLIELLIVVAIIGILAAIAIPQFSRYRIQGFNSSASSDLRNLKTSEESLYAEYQRYGASNNTALPGTGAAAGVVVQGPGTIAAPTIITLMDSGAVPAARGLAIPVGNNVRLGAAAVALVYTSYNAVTKHISGDTAYGADTDSTTIFLFKGFPAVATAVSYSIILADVPAPVTGTIEFTALGWNAL
jgi:prepilin-type N-terminal cleavage/methylation domain-containing protein